MPKPFSPIVTTILVPFSPGIFTLVPFGYVEPSDFFLGVTFASPVILSGVISISPNSAVSGAVGSIFPGVSTFTSTVGLPGSLILPVPGVSSSGKSLFGTVPFPSLSIVTTIGLPFLPGISTLVFSGYVVPSGFLGFTVTSPVAGSCVNSTVGVLRAGVVTATG